MAGFSGALGCAAEICGSPGVGLRYMLSMVGRRAAPNGVFKNSVGRSDRSHKYLGFV